MDAAASLAPRRISDSFDAVCGKCKQVAYRELIVGDLQPDGSYKHHKIVTGGFTQECDSEGVPTGPVIPKCMCEEQ